ncbi:hypothetical protein QQY24_34075 [Streptomyces sp. TG1A-8]|uniref:hypothetical protein n=1 Tax=Streptomyces sp. TG1A-8 TaxID=3051385 RepID=UPI00265B9A1C|nr:hypothetical protein [Streptomyces sp. TG1A-8]MDO0930094.1 hypothetical protein [Streptomyces sp. TG1A-8]
MPAPGVSGEPGVHSPSSAPIHNPHTGVLPLFESAQVDFQALFLELSPRASIRVDRRSGDGEWLHSYVDRTLPQTAPRGPYAVYLADEDGRFCRLCFDLDTKLGDVGPDLATLLRALDEAGLTYVVAASGSAGGRHVWVTGLGIGGLAYSTVASSWVQRGRC